MSHLGITKLIEWIEKDFTTHGFPKLAIILSGKSKKNNFFIFAISSDGMIAKPHTSNDSIEYVVSTNDNIPLFSQHFKNILEYGIKIEQAIIDTIRYASTIDKSISNKCDLVIID